MNIHNDSHDFHLKAPDDLCCCCRMAGALGRGAATSSRVDALSFSMYTDEEIDALAVVDVHNPAHVDSLNRPQPGGLYDPAMGPLDSHSRCATCRLQHAFCPGHCGKIVAPVPLFNPLLFTTLVRILKCTCLACFHLRLGRSAAMRVTRTLSLLRRVCS